ncbi:MAG TPA: tyrosine-type recombinase/integrase [Dehalococcoidia bacterium]|nr:tyrosine-type recombinase/integrase [Dehalococcoidia bacterium]
MPRIRFHDLRHSCATLLLEQGVHPRIVADLLGHSTTTLTLNTYSHVTPRLQQTAVDALSAVLQA